MMEHARFTQGQQVKPTERSILHDLFPDTLGKIVEAPRYSTENQRWLYMVEFPFGAYPFPEDHLQEVICSQLL